MSNKNISQLPFSEGCPEKSGYSRLKAITEKYGPSPATIWRKSKNGTFPKPYKLSSGITAWKNSDLNEWEKDPLNYRTKS